MQAGEAWCQGEKSRRVLLRTLPKLCIVLAGVANGNASAFGKVKQRADMKATKSCLSVSSEDA